ncbi:MAG TPA: ABC transporter substrate-binding protein [Burkholderiaceae bacterium]|jgi:ABC-type transport system substrate-binding protein|nr:ABC transporter substrate-binding protein [Burkholderiaceae bacterium]
MRAIASALALAALAALACALVTPAHAQEKSVLTVPRITQFESLDPPRGFGQTEEQVLRQVYSTLVAYAYLERPYKLEPDLLEAMPTLSPDQLTLTFHLRQGVRFIDSPCFPGGKGRELTSDDVLYSLKRYADGNINSKSWFAMQGAVVGLDDYRAATVKAGPGADLTSRDVAGLHKVDARTFTIRLTHANALFLYALAMAPTSVVPREAVQFYKDRFALNPVGTGPFMATRQLDRKGVIRLVRNPHYHRTYPSVGEPGDAARGLLRDAGKRLPLVDELEMPLIEEQQPAALKFLRGELDWRPMDRANFSKMVLRNPDGTFRLTPEFAGRFAISDVPSLETDYMLVNMRDPLLGGNKLLRQALAAAFDAQAIIDVLWNGRGRRLNSLVPYDLPGNERETGAVARPHDLAQARKLLAQAGYPDGKGLPPLTISFFQTHVAAHNEFDLLKAQLAAIGVQAKGVFMDQPTFTKAAENGNYQLASFGWEADYPDPEDFYQLLYGRNAPPASNWTGYANPAYDKAYEASRFMANGPERLAYLRKMNALIADDVPMIVTFDPLKFESVQNWVGNFKRNLLAQEHMYLSVDMARKRKGVQ